MTICYKSACRMCHGGCGVLVHVNDGKVIKVQGDPASPLNRGSMCPKGLASIEQLYHPDRLKHPLKRAGKRGEGKWKRISWEEALNTHSLQDRGHQGSLWSRVDSAGSRHRSILFHVHSKICQCLGYPELV